MAKTTPQQPATACSLHEWEGLRSYLLFAREAVIPAGNADGTYVRHGEYSAHFIRRGWLQMSAEGEQARVGVGQWLFCFAEKIHQTLDPDTHILSVRVVTAWPDDDLLFRSTRKLLLIDAAEHPQLEPLARQIIADLGPIQSHQENPAYTYRWRTRLSFDAYVRHQQHLLQWTSFVADLLQRRGWTLRIPRGIDGRLAKALNLIDELAPDAAFPRIEVQHLSGLTLKQLDRLCRESLQLTLRGYWDGRRVHAARFRLDQPGSSIKQTAVDLGFSQLSHFSAWFKRYTGVSPRAYRADPDRK